MRYIGSMPIARLRTIAGILELFVCAGAAPTSQPAVRLARANVGER